VRYREYCERPNMPTQKLTAEIIVAAIQGYEFQKTGIDAKITDLRAMLPGGSAEAAATPTALTPEDGPGSESEMGEDQR
jgi:hypothetical protein